MQYIKKSDIVYKDEDTVLFDDKLFILIDFIDSLPAYNPYDEIIKVIDAEIDSFGDMSKQGDVEYGYIYGLQELKDKLLTK